MATINGARFDLKSKNKPTTRNQARMDALRKQVKMWGYGVLGLTVIMSCGLNGHANAQHAAAGLEAAAWGMGLAIPLIVLGLSQLAGLLYRLNFKYASYATAIVSAVVLLLSVHHCSTSIVATTGASLWLAVPMAIGIDAGLVCSKVAILLAERE